MLMIAGGHVYKAKAMEQKVENSAFEWQSLVTKCDLSELKLWANLNNISEHINQQDQGGHTLLHTAIIAEAKEDAIDWLLVNKANPNLQTVMGNTALHLAIMNAERSSCAAILRLLSHENVDVNLMDNDGNTILDIAQKKKVLVKEIKAKGGLTGEQVRQQKQTDGAKTSNQQEKEKEQEQQKNTDAEPLTEKMGAAAQQTEVKKEIAKKGKAKQRAGFLKAETLSEGASGFGPGNSGSADKSINEIAGKKKKELGIDQEPKDKAVPARRLNRCLLCPLASALTAVTAAFYVQNYWTDVQADLKMAKEYLREQLISLKKATEQWLESRQAPGVARG